MQNRSALWQSITSEGDFGSETVAIIDENQYDPATAPVINRGMSEKMLSIGNCVSACLRLELRTETEIAKSAEIQMIHRVVGTSLNMPIYSEWLPAGTFYVSERERNYATGITKLTCYDAMLKTREVYFVNGIIDYDIWPKPMVEVVEIIAERIGVEIDDRTVINTGADYMVYMPSFQQTMMDILGLIAIVHGGNWIITPDSKLRLIPLQSMPEEDEEGVVQIPAVLSSLTIGRRVVVSRITMTNGEGDNKETYTAGDDTGFEIKIEQNAYASQELCDRLLLLIGGIEYQAFQMRGALFDPALELGDKIAYRDIVSGVMLQMDTTHNAMFRGDLIAPEDKQIVDEYPYVNEAQKAANEIRERADSGEFDGTVMRIDSSRGVLFKNNVFSTVLSVTIIKGPRIIRNAAAMHQVYGRSAYLQWKYKKFDDEDWRTLSASDSHLSNDGFSLTITPDDVDEKIVFMCEMET